MILNIIKTWLRNFRKNKTYSFLNIFGLAIGIACSGLIFLWMENELSYDQTYAKKDRVYKVRTNQKYQGKIRTFDATPGPLAPAMTAEIPGIARACRFARNEDPLFSLGDKALNAPGFYVDSSLFDMFTPEFVEGNAKDAFHDLYSIVITEKMALQFFGTTTNVVGKTLRQDNKQDFVVTGVIRNIPENATIQFDWCAPYEVFRKRNEWLQYWGANGLQTYIELDPGANPDRIGHQLQGFIADKKKDAGAARPILFSMNDWRLRDHFEEGIHLPGGRITYIHLFAMIAWIIILIACINFMNLATARSEKRSREVGVRKVLGAPRKMLIGQFIGEAIAMALIAVVIGALLIRLTLPAFNLLVEKQLVAGFGKPLHLLYLLGIGLGCGLLAGSYPALYLSAFNPVFVLKGIRRREGPAATIRKGLVILQFTVSIVLIIGTVIIYQQIRHVKTRELGYNYDNLVKINLQGQLQSHLPAIRQQLIQTGMVENMATSNNEILYIGRNSTEFDWAGKDPGKSILISYRYISPDFVPTWGLNLLKGRSFYADPTVDSNNVIITESFAKLMGRDDAVGKNIFHDDKPFRVVGVVKDLVYGDMYTPSDPIAFFSSNEIATRMYIRLKAQSNAEQAIPAIEKIIRANNPGYPFSYRFVSDQFNEIFKSENLVGKLSRVFAGLAIFISCLGLFGLSAYTAERRTREIGIRKVLGASVPGIASLLSTEFMRLVLIATLIAFPLAWWTMHSWLQNFAYHIDIGWQAFAAAGSAAILVALATISFQAIRAATANPVKSLRSE